jgi:hypothetical protein
MSSRTLASLVGRPLRGTIGEPWNFVSDAGQSVIVGKIESVSPAAIEAPWLLCRIQPFVHEGRTITQVVAVERYARAEPLPNLCVGARVGVNLMFDATGKPLAPSRVAEFLASKTGRFLAGSIQVTD